MMRLGNLVSALAVGFGLLVFAAAAPVMAAQAGQAAAGPQTGKLERIVPGHYVYSSGARLSGIIETSDGVLVLDSLSNAAMAQHERQLIASTIGKPIRYLVSSTFHGNYALGNVAYGDAVKIGHEFYKADLIEMMNEEKLSAAEQAAMLPNQTFRDRMTVFLGGKEIQILHIGAGHTRGDAIVFVPADRIVYLSEMFFDGRFPFMNSGYVNWINAIDIALAMEADIFVPGQGPSDIAANPRASRQNLVKARQVLVDARDAVMREIAKGSTEDQAVAAIPMTQYRGMVGYDQQRAVLIRRMYQDLKGLLR